MRKQIKTVPKPVMDALVSCDWPGNIRELRNLLERAIILTQGEELNVPLAELQMAQTRSSTPRVSSFQAAEREAILNALKLSNGRLSGPGGAAESLGLKRTTLQNKMRRLNISKKDFQRLL
jgi:formate hydrogenlyase transcriptional activator